MWCLGHSDVMTENGWGVELLLGTQEDAFVPTIMIQ